jgi:biopolymer transport protein ExbB
LTNAPPKIIQITRLLPILRNYKFAFAAANTAENRNMMSRRWLGFLLICSLVIFAWGSAASSLASPQEGENNAVEASPSSGSPADGKPAPKNMLAWTFEALGWTYTITFLAMSFVFVALLVMNILAARRSSVCPISLVQAFEGHLDGQQFQEAYELAKNDDSFLGQVLAAGLSKASVGYPQAIEAMQEVGEDENMKLEHRLSYIALIGTLSPMVGLFGTVDGMIRSFSEIAQGGQPKPADLAKGISTALFTTFVGLAIAIPAILAYNLLKNRLARLVLEVGIMSEGLMSRFDTGRAKR